MGAGSGNGSIRTFSSSRQGMTADASIRPATRERLPFITRVLIRPFPGRAAVPTQARGC